MVIKKNYMTAAIELISFVLSATQSIYIQNSKFLVGALKVSQAPLPK